MFTIITSGIILAIAIFAISSEITFSKRKSMYIDLFPIGVSATSAAGTSIFSILVERGVIDFCWWQGIGLALIVVLLGFGWSYIDSNNESSNTIYPWISTVLNLIVFAVASIVAWLG